MTTEVSAASGMVHDSEILKDSKRPLSVPPSGRQVFRLGDEVLAEVMRMVQLGFLTNTNVVDLLRTIRVESKTGEPTVLVPTPEYLAYQDKNIKDLEATANRLLAEETTPASGVSKNIKLN